MLFDRLIGSAHLLQLQDPVLLFSYVWSLLTYLDYLNASLNTAFLKNIKSSCDEYFIFSRTDFCLKARPLSRQCITSEGKVTLFHVCSSFSYETGINGN